jgi:uncharacterized protein DUF2877
MPSVEALSIAPAARDWLAGSRRPRLLHVFDRACNLVNEHRDILSVVAPEIGNGPFNLVVNQGHFFSGRFDAVSPVSILGDHLTLGDWAINTGAARLWSARPDWEGLHAHKGNILEQLTPPSISNYQPHLPNQLLSSFSSALARADLQPCLAATRKLAGLGGGLTPAGDDFMLGALYAVWIIHRPGEAGALAGEVANAAAPLTTSLSAAWLRSAGRGEAGIMWHDLLCGLMSGDRLVIAESTGRILAVGETSGADAFAGFMNTLSRWAELTGFKIP